MDEVAQNDLAQNKPAENALVENPLVKTLDKIKLNDLHAAPEVAMRPGYGQSGRKLEVLCNAFSLKPGSGTLHQYAIVLEHPRGTAMPRSLNYKCFDKMVADTILPPEAVYDGGQLMFSPHPLERSEASGEVMVESSILPTREEIWKYKYWETVTMPFTELRALLCGNIKQLPAALSVLQAIGIALRHGVASQHFTMRDKYFPKGQQTVYIKGVQIQQGFVATVQGAGNFLDKAAMPNILLNIDLASGVFYQDSNHSKMSSVMALCLERLEIEPSLVTVNRLVNISDDRLRPLNHFLKNLIVDIKIQGQAPRTRKVRSLSSASAANYSFENQAGQTISVAQHFWITYNVRLRWPDLPCVLFGARQLAFPIEFCFTRPDQIYRLKLDAQMQQRALKQQTVKPDNRFKWICKARDKGTGDFAKLESLGLEVSKDLLRIKARVIQSPDVMYGQAIPVKLEKLPGSWIAKGCRYCEPKPLESWAVLDLAGSDVGQIQRFVGILAQKLRSSGVVVANKQPPITRQVYCRSRNLRSNMALWIEDSARSAHDVFNKPVGLILVITENKNDNALYQAIKVEGDNLVAKMPPFTTQVMCKQHLRSPNDQYMTNLGLKVNLKLGGINHKVNQVTAAAGKATMVVGADVAHGTGAGKPSTAAMVASMDRNMMQYTCTAAVQPLVEPSSGMDQTRVMVQEPIVECRGMMTILLNRWAQCWAQCAPDKRVPRHVIYYRDGVSDSELASIERTEIPEIQGALEAAVQRHCPESGIRVELTYVVCNKRNTYRFMPLPREDNHKGNCPAGTIVDRDIVSPFYFDYYAITHGAIQGTSRPVRYIVLRDDAKMTADKIQEFTSHLCYGYQRATRAVGLVTPAYYADLVAARARLWILNDDDDSTSSNGCGGTSQQERSAILGDCQAKVRKYLAGMEQLAQRMWWL